MRNQVHKEVAKIRAYFNCKIVISGVNRELGQFLFFFFANLHVIYF